MHLYYLNLDRRPDRNRAFIARLPPGVTARKCWTPDWRDRQWPEIKNNPYYTPCTAAQHTASRAIWEMIAKRCTWGTIAADDVVLRHDFATQAHARMDELPLDWDIVFWGITLQCGAVYQLWPGGPYVQTRTQTMTELPDEQAFRESRAETNLHHVVSGWNTECYSLSPKGARHLLKYAWPIQFHNGHCPGVEKPFAIYGLDALLAALLGGMSAWLCWPPIAHHPLDKADSNMDEVTPEVSHWAQLENYATDGI